jgi:hypothetical protein
LNVGRDVQKSHLLKTGFQVRHFDDVLSADVDSAQKGKVLDHVISLLSACLFFFCRENIKEFWKKNKTTLVIF